MHGTYRYVDMTMFEGLICALASIAEGVVGLILVPFKIMPPDWRLRNAKWVARRRNLRSTPKPLGKSTDSPIS